MNKDTGTYREIRPGEAIHLNEVEFAIGQEIEISGHRFRVLKITKKDMVLRPVRQQA